MMTPTELTRSEDELFDRWERGYEGKFYRDGVPCPERYLAAKIRVLLILKEPYDRWGKPWDARAALTLHMDTAYTWSNAARWAKALQTLPNPPAWKEVAHQTEATRQDAILGVAVMNLKKVTGGAATIPTEVHAFVEANAEYVREQIALYEPHITLLCGTAPYIGYLYTQEQQGPRRETRAGVFYRRFPALGCMIRFRHPQTRGTRMQPLYEQLVEGAQEIYEREISAGSIPPVARAWNVDDQGGRGLPLNRAR